MEDLIAKTVIARFANLVTERANFERDWQDIRDLVRPNTSDFQRQLTPGSSRTDAIFDGTAPEALVEFASALHSHLTNPADRWFTLEIRDMQRIENDPEAQQWLEDTADAIYDAYSNETTNFNTAIHECYLDVGGFGTAIVGQEWNGDDGQLNFRAHPLADCYVAENKHGKVDTLYRKVCYSTRQLFQEFGESALPQAVKDEKDQDKKWEVIHAVFPRTDRNPFNLSSRNMPFASAWVLKDKGWTLKESGYRSFPYHVPRWMKLASEIYGRGPGINCLPDIRMLNRMEFTIIKAATKATDPPLVVPNDGFLLPIKTAPGSLIFKEPGAEPIEALEHKGNFPIAREMSIDRREMIRKAFHSEWVKLELKKAEQTAYEIQERLEQQLRMLAPMLGRLMSELLSPTIQRSYELLRENGRISHSPVSLQGTTLKLVYISAAARAQRGVKATSINRFAQELLPYAQVDPSVMHAINFNALAQELALIRGVSRKILRTPEEVAELQAQQQQQQQMAALAAAAEPASKAVKNLADAQSVAMM